MARDPRFEAVRRARIGSPVLVSAPGGEPACWLVPFELDARACGVARVELTMAVSQVSTFGSGPDDRVAWPENAFFDRPPAALVAQAAARHPALRVDAARFSYDGTPSKWGWRIEADDGKGTVVFITPGGWYAREERPAAEAEREG